MKPHRLLLASLRGLVTLGILHGAVQASTYTVVNIHDNGSGSLREAIEAANANPGLDVIGFAIGGGGAQVIQLLTALPVVTDPVVIDGTTQLGFSGAPLIEIDGTVAGGTGLRIVTGSSTILALGFNQFPDAGISLEVGSDNRVSNVRASWSGLGLG